MKLISIGVVRNKITEPGQHDWGNLVSEIIINEEYEQALDCIEEFSHIFVLYWMNRLQDAKRSTLKVHPRGRHDLPLVGVFTSRSQTRPNPIGLTIAEILEVHGTIVKVKGLDALDGTPVIDIKPYIPENASPPRVRVPDWIKKLTNGIH
jgi:tRNA (adenine37-N6)-methyltransferase